MSVSMNPPSSSVPIKGKSPNETTYASSVMRGEVDSTPNQNTETKRGLISRHAQMIALGGTIGTGHFVGSGQVLRMGGPLFLFLAYSTITVLLYGVATATGEISVSRSLGFKLGWVYWYIFAITVPAEINVTALIIDYWNPPVHNAVWLTIVGAVIILCNCLPVRVYGETEFWHASTKVIGILGLLIMAVVLFFGGRPNHDPLYFRYWGNPGPVNAYLVEGAVDNLAAFIGCTTFSVYAFGFASELLVITGGEMESPRRNIPKATMRYFYRLITFYILGAFAIGIIVPSNNKDLLSPGSGAAASPWAIGARDAGIKALDSAINAVIVLSAWSAGNPTCISPAEPSTLCRSLDTHPPFSADVPSQECHTTPPPSVPHSARCIYLNVAASGSAVFNWMANLINTGAFQSWICCCIIYIRFRKAVEAQAVTDIPFRSRLQPYAAWVSLVGFSILLLVNGFKVFVNGYWSVADFITSYIGVAIFAVLYIGHKFTVGAKDRIALRPEEVGLHTGVEEIILQEKPR